MQFVRGSSQRSPMLNLDPIVPSSRPILHSRRGPFGCEDGRYTVSTIRVFKIVPPLICVIVRAAAQCD